MILHMNEAGCYRRISNKQQIELKIDVGEVRDALFLSESQFRRRFREECDVLLIDDLQFLGKKQETQNEFFYTFNALHQTSKAVVLTSDTVPAEIPGLEERLPVLGPVPGARQAFQLVGVDLEPDGRDAVGCRVE